MREDPNKVTYFGVTDSRGKRVPFGIKRKDRARHMYVIGKTGMGKSTLLENMAIQDIRNGEGLGFIDPHGSTAEKLLEFVPDHRVDDVVYFAPFDMDHPVAFNVMEDVGYDKRHLVVSGLLSAFRKIWVDAWSARMEYILSNTLLALLEYPDATLLDVNRMLINKNFRKKVVEKVTDPIVKSFWVDEFANYTDRYTQDATPAIQNKIGQFTSNPLIRNIVGQPKSSFDIRKMMDERKIIIMNLSKGKVGEVNATLLGSMLVTKIYLAAMSRADASAQALADLPSFYFYVDEFQSFANQSFADILSEARKYKLNLIIAHQYIEQMEEEVRNAVFGNVGTTVTFRVGPFDAEVLETVFSPQFTSEDLVNLGFAQVYLTLMIDGVGSPPFSATTLPPFDFPPETFVSKVLDRSRGQFSKPRPQVEDFIEKWQNDAVGLAGVPAKKAADTARPYKPDTAPAPKAAPQTEPKAGPKPERQPEQPAPAPASALTPRPLHGTTPLEKRLEKREGTPPRRGDVEPLRRPQKPDLTGAKSLKEAIERATKERIANTPPADIAKREERRQPESLKSTLGRVAPDAAAPKPQEKPQSQPPREQQPQPRTREEGRSEEEVLRKMLEVEGFDG